MSHEDIEWTCGHVAGAHCAECYRLLAVKAHRLAVDNIELSSAVVDRIAEWKLALASLDQLATTMMKRALEADEEGVSREHLVLYARSLQAIVVLEKMR